MTAPAARPLVTTIRERCRVCYTCVRECPSKAIRVAGGQAEVLPERCIGCGNCVRVCSQKAKRALSSRPEAEALLASGARVAACVAPSFPAEFTDVPPARLAGMLRALGFALVCEVAFGADLVADRYARLLAADDGARHVATTCPAIVQYVKRHHAGLTDALAPIVSPMIAAARALRRLHGDGLRVVFVGPCIAKKAEAESGRVAGDVDAVLTFAELRELLAARGIRPEDAEDSGFDPPRPGAGALFPLARGMLQAAGIGEDLAGDVVAADGRAGFVEAIKEFEAGDLDARLVELLSCNGCLMGPGMTTTLPLFSRRSRVAAYARARLRTLDRAAWRAAIDGLAGLDLSRGFDPKDQTEPPPPENRVRAILAGMGKTAPADELNCGACGYETCREHAAAIARGLAESETCLPYTIDELRRTVREVARSHEELAGAQEALLHAEKLASMGQLAAGIAHEVNNPLGVVLMLAHVLLDESAADAPIRGDLARIAEHADRCKKIVAGLLNFARQSKVVRRPTDLMALAERALKSVPLPPSITARVEAGDGDPVAEIDGDQVLQVLTNLIANAAAAMEGGGTLTIAVGGDARSVRLIVTDTGIGVPAANLGKIWEPFFTTKPLGKGTGLGLAVTYGIVKMHRGDVAVASNADPAAGPTGTTFTVTLPRAEAEG